MSAGESVLGADDRRLLATGALLAGLGVVLGAMAAHALAPRLSERSLAAFETGARYQLVHGIAIVLCAIVAERLPGARTAGWLFAAGVLFFSGSLYGLSLTGAGFFGPITPLGGACFIAGWLLLAYRALRAGAR